MGIKAHFQGECLTETLVMHLFKGGYVGISPIEGKVNVAAIVEKKRMVGAETFMEEFSFLFPKNRLLDWMCSPIPEFGAKIVPDWKGCFFIGEGIGTIPPITGNGLSMAIAGGCLAAEVSLGKGDQKEYTRKWRERYLAPIRWGKLFHKMVIHSNFVSPLIRYFPPIISWGYRQTRSQEM